MRTNRALVTSASVILGLLCAFPVGAWNQVGHRTVAEVAWRQLSPQQRRAISDLLQQHPHYKEMLAAEVPQGVSTNEWVFLSAAVWPDWVRPAKAAEPVRPVSITKYDLYPHAIGHPFLKAGDTNRALVEKFVITQPNAEMVLSNSIATLRDSKASAHDRAVSLCWVLHLFGDLHQPLHAASRVTREKPEGEGLGGGHYALDPRREPGRNRINLHTFWDQLPGTDTAYQAVIQLADQLSSAPELKPAAMSELRQNKSIGAWVQESFRAAVDFAYSEDRARYVYLDKKSAGKVADSEIPALSSEYVSEARKIALRRLALAGQRLADELKNAFEISP